MPNPGIARRASIGGRSPQIFISYGKEDLPVAARIAALLQKVNCGVWLDRHQLLPGTEWRREIKKAIRESDYFLALISTRSLTRRGFIHTELKEGLTVWSETPFSRVYLIPVRIDDCDLTEVGLGELHWVDLFDHNDLRVSEASWDRAIASILEAVAHGRGYSPDALNPQLAAQAAKYGREREALECSIAATLRTTLTVQAAADIRCQFADSVTARLFEEVARAGGFIPGSFTLVARGGFGRRYLTRNSDIDLTLLHTQDDRRDAQKLFDVFSMLLADIWGDIRVAPIINTVEECVDHWRTNFSSLAAFSSTRLVYGNSYIFTQLLAEWQAFVVALNPEAIQAGIHAQPFYCAVERELPTLLNVKFCPGGLMEIAHVEFLEKLLETLGVDTGGITPARVAVDLARNFMLRLRDEVYLITRTNAVTARGLAAVAAAILSQTANATEILLRDLHRHRMEVRTRLDALLSLALTAPRNVPHSRG